MINIIHLYYYSCVFVFVLYLIVLNVCIYIIYLHKYLRLLI